MEMEEVVTSTEQQTATSETEPEFDAFAAALLGDDGGDQPAAPEATTEPDAQTEPTGQDQPAGADAADTQTEGQPEENEPSGEAQTEGHAAETLPLSYMDSAFQLDAAAVQSIAGALGSTQQDVIALLQKGMNYEHKASREIGILNDFAQASGMTLDQYLNGLESAREENLVQTEMQQVAAEMPEGTPEEALRRIAERNVADRRAERQQQAQQAAQLAAQQADRGRVDAWGALLGEYPELRDPQNVPQGLFEIMAKQGCTPSEAFYRVQAQQQAAQLAEAKRALEVAQQKQKNKETAVGSQSTAGDDGSDAFLKALFS